jgi:hypothetical protein
MNTTYVINETDKKFHLMQILGYYLELSLFEREKLERSNTWSKR